MLKKLVTVIVLACMVSYVSAGTASIGTASARGDLRVDNYLVRGNATLFDGSVVETGQATADLRLGKGTEITMATSSRGTLYRNRLVLQQGESQLAAGSSFKLEASGLRVTPIQANSRGVVALRPGNTVEVAVLNGSFGVANAQGILLASVRHGQALSFAMKGGTSSTSFSGIGVVSSENGHFYISTEGVGEKYELTGKNLKKYVGKKVLISGTVQAGVQQAGGSTPVVSVNSVNINCTDLQRGNNESGTNGLGAKKSLFILGAILAPAAGIGLAVNSANQSSTPASR